MGGASILIADGLLAPTGPNRQNVGDRHHASFVRMLLDGIVLVGVSKAFTNVEDLYEKVAVLQSQMEAIE